MNDMIDVTVTAIFCITVTLLWFYHPDFGFLAWIGSAMVFGFIRDMIIRGESDDK